ncbi:MAG: Xanthine dehydrogenase molybdenum-binding subunit [Firmicutes bacterium ADurb.Bin182]|nr:MAG: Xanthine dehydrogenase molybdenum-binding subunit [Firmicutes bacterium ADurb.Bin182]
MSVGKSVKRVDAYEKVTGRARYTDDFLDYNPLIAKVLHSTIANGKVLSMDISEAVKIPGVVKIVTCFDVPDIRFPTAGHPWSTDPKHQDVADRKLLNTRVRLYGDDIAAVIAEDEVAAAQALRKIKVEYEEYEPILDVFRAMEPDAPLLHEEFPNNILAHSGYEEGDFEEAIKEEGLLKFEGWYETPIVQHCHIEPVISYAYMEKGRITVVASTQIPHIVRRITAQALGLPWGKVRIIKPYIGGGFGNKQDALYEPLNAYLTTQVGGRCVKLEISREETFVSTRVRHSIKFHITSYVRKDGRFVARYLKSYANQGAYTSHGHAIAAKGGAAFKQLYSAEGAVKADLYSVFTNTPAAGAMRAYGIPQITFAMESHSDDIARALNMDPIEFRRINMMKKGFYDPFSQNENYYDSLNAVIAKGKEYFKWDEKVKAYANQTGPVRKGVGMSIFWYNTAVWPTSLEASTCRMVLNQDGSIQMQMPETEIGQGADTVFSQMAAHTLGIPFENVHIVSTQDTDITPFGTGAYASRQTYIGGMVIKKTAEILKEKILSYARSINRIASADLDIEDGNIINKYSGKVLMSVGELATEALYSMQAAEHITAESTYQCKTNALSMGCCFAEVEVDIPLGKVSVLDIINVHDCGMLINPKLAEAQVHGGVSMSLGFGLSEQLIFDPKTGRPLNNNFLDYKLLTALDHPDIQTDFVEFYEPTSAYGTKALGEPPTVPPAPAIRNAVLNATGVAINEAPLNPHKCFAKFKEAGLI